MNAPLLTRPAIISTRRARKATLVTSASSRNRNARDIDETLRIESKVKGAGDAYHPAAILFVDMVGFTTFCLENSPSCVLITMRDLLGMMSAIVATHGGGIEKFLGDGFMAVFHASQLRSREASSAVRCAIALQNAIDAWNIRQGRRDESIIQFATGIHCGKVIVASLGYGDCKELVVLGDTVNVASRVEGKCRCLNASILVTSQVIQKISCEGERSLVKRFTNFGFQELRGRSGYMHLLGQKR